MNFPKTWEFDLRYVPIQLVLLQSLFNVQVGAQNRRCFEDGIYVSSLEMEILVHLRVLDSCQSTRTHYKASFAKSHIISSCPERGQCKYLLSALCLEASKWLKFVHPLVLKTRLWKLYKCKIDYWPVHFYKKSNVLQFCRASLYLPFPPEVRYLTYIAHKVLFYH